MKLSDNCTMSTKTIAYLRVSTGCQELGLDVQLDQCRAFNDKIDAVFSDECKNCYKQKPLKKTQLQSL